MDERTSELGGGTVDAAGVRVRFGGGGGGGDVAEGCVETALCGERNASPKKRSSHSARAHASRTKIEVR
jgi:hypothetical protein